MKGQGQMKGEVGQGHMTEIEVGQCPWKDREWIEIGQKCKMEGKVEETHLNQTQKMKEKERINLTRKRGQDQKTEGRDREVIALVINFIAVV